MYNLELQKFYQSYGEHILISLCKDYNRYFSFKHEENSKLSDHILKRDLSRIIEEICYNLIKNGKHKMYYIVDNKNKSKVIKFSSKPISAREINFIFPSTILKEHERKKLIRDLTNLNSNQIYENGMKWIKFMPNMKKKVDLEIGKLGRSIYIHDYSWPDYYTDYYYVHRKIQEMLAQRKLVDYVLSIINLTVINIFKLESDDIILFNGKTIDELNRLHSELQKNSKSVDSIYKELNDI